MKASLVFLAAIALAPAAWSDPALLACLGPEAEVRAAEIRDTAPCAQDATCQPAPLSLYAVQVEMRCFGEKADRCLREDDTLTCLETGEATLHEQTLLKRDEVPADRVASVLSRLSRFAARSLRSDDAAMRANLAAGPCSDAAVKGQITARADDPDVAQALCDFFDAVITYQRVTAIIRTVDAAEAGR